MAKPISLHRDPAVLPQQGVDPPIEVRPDERAPLITGDAKQQPLVGDNRAAIDHAAATAAEAARHAAETGLAAATSAIEKFDPAKKGDLPRLTKRLEQVERDLDSALAPDALRHANLEQLGLLHRAISQFLRAGAALPELPVLTKISEHAQLLSRATVDAFLSSIDHRGQDTRVLHSETFAKLPDPASILRHLGGFGTDRKLALLDSLLRSEPFTRFDPATQNLAAEQTLHHLDERDRRTMRDLIALPGFARLGPAEQQKLLRYLGGTNPELSTPARKQLTAELPALVASDPEKQAAELRRHLQDQPSKSHITRDEGADFSEHRTIYTAPKPNVVERFKFKSMPEGGKAHSYELKVGGYLIPVHRYEGYMHYGNTPRAEEMFEAIACLPPVSLSLLKEVVLEPKANPEDEWHAKKFGKEEFKAAATVSEGLVRIWSDSQQLGQRGNRLVATMLHETGHTLSFKFFGNRYEDPGWDRWKAAIQNDGIRPSNYATYTPGEDFCESYALYWTVKGTAREEEVRALMPERFALIEELIAKQETAMKAEETDYQRAVRENRTAIVDGAAASGVSNDRRTQLLKTLTGAPEDRSFGTALATLASSESFARLDSRVVADILPLFNRLGIMKLDARPLADLIAAPAFAELAPKDQLRLARAGGVIADNASRPLFEAAQAALAGAEGLDAQIRALSDVVAGQTKTMFETFSFDPRRLQRERLQGFETGGVLEVGGNLERTTLTSVYGRDSWIDVHFPRGAFESGDRLRISDALCSFNMLQQLYVSSLYVTRTDGPSSAEAAGDQIRVQWNPKEEPPLAALHLAAAKIVGQRAMENGGAQRWEAARTGDDIFTTKAASADPLTDFAEAYLMRMTAADREAIEATIPRRAAFFRDVDRTGGWDGMKAINRGQVEKRIALLRKEPAYAQLSMEQQRVLERHALQEPTSMAASTIEATLMIVRHALPKLEAADKNAMLGVLLGQTSAVGPAARLVTDEAFALIAPAARQALLRQLAVAGLAQSWFSALDKILGDDKTSAADRAAALEQLASSNQLLPEMSAYRTSGVGSHNPIRVLSSERADGGERSQLAADGRTLEIFRADGNAWFDKDKLWGAISSMPKRVRDLIPGVVIESKSDERWAIAPGDGKVHLFKEANNGPLGIARLISASITARALERWGSDTGAAAWKPWKEAAAKDGVELSRAAGGDLIRDFTESVAFYLSVRNYLGGENLLRLESARPISPNRFALIEQFLGAHPGRDDGFSEPSQRDRWYR